MKDLFKVIEDRGLFIDNLKTNKLGCIKIAIVREVVNPMIIRSTSPDEVLSYKFPSGKEALEIPARKLKSREKLRGLKQARLFDAVSEELHYNSIKKSDYLANVNSITFGDSVTESGDAVGLPTRVVYDWGYSIQDVNDISDTLQHNALGESGTMWDEEEGKLRQSLFQVQYVKQGALIPHFITLENVTPIMLFHLLSAVIYENRYGAQSRTTGMNMVNHIVGVGFGREEAAINSYLISRDWDHSLEPTLDNVSKKVSEVMESFYSENLLNGEELVKAVKEVWESGKDLEKEYKGFQNLSEKFLQDIGVIKGKKKR
ncbi:type I-D CRISPR-associated protein Cas7/Csc2 [Flammeovirga sp. EKP202]|uniref:type I-D CRISPR-associated protein Cas7/Csc2 n=1 Tax=Flammeovirga sp. EKP202 TaxID=2770592 RepID=UPI00165FE87D|nr:type I-D CRISPR-associated protein Cas7/Csc2 [Flammeovirga sp. EKP202]MBD0405054.1 type I-D CRISPR-associated protein Cas7/Csc2 [Flammeovirga sp. EKP202]